MEQEYKKSMIINQYKMQMHMEKSGISHTELEILRNYHREATLSSPEKSISSLGNIPRIYYNIGKLTVFPMSFQNNSRKTNNYIIVIEDPLESQELSLVTNVNEWKHLCIVEGADQPFRWNILSSSGQFTLKPNEKLSFLLKQFTINPPEYRSRQRVAKIMVKNFESDLDEKVTHLVLIYSETYVNGEFVLQEPENEAISISLPAEIHSSKISVGKFLLCSQENYRVSLGINNSLTLQCTTPNSSNSQEFYVYLFRDMFYYEIIAIFKVLLQTYQVLKVYTKAGKKSMQNLEIQSSNRDRKIEIHSSNSQVCRIIETCHSIIEVQAYEKAQVQLISFPYHVGQSRVFLHIVDAYTREVFQRVMVQYEATAPQVDSKYELNASRGNVTKSSFLYFNRESRLRIIEFSCSQPELLQISKPVHAVEANQSKDIEVLINPVSFSKESFVLVYASESEKTTTEVFSFTISFIY